MQYYYRWVAMYSTHVHNIKPPHIFIIINNNLRPRYLNKASLDYTKSRVTFISCSLICETINDVSILTTNQSIFVSFLCHHIHTNVIQSLYAPSHFLRFYRFYLCWKIIFHYCSSHIKWNFSQYLCQSNGSVKSINKNSMVLTLKWFTQFTNNLHSIQHVCVVIIVIRILTSINDQL